MIISACRCYWFKYPTAPGF